MTDKPRGVHDLGGLPAGPIDKTVHESSLFEKRVDALMILMSHPDRRVITVDELRRGIESFPPEEYVELAYYERWVFVLKKLMLEKNILSEEEISERVEVVRKRLDAGGEL